MAIAGDGAGVSLRDTRQANRSIRSPQHVGIAVTLVGLAGLVVAAFLPWVQSGEAERSSFAALSSAHRLGIAETGWQRVAVDLWFFVPAFAVLAVIALLLGRRSAFAALVIILAVVAMGVAVLVIVAAENGVGPLLACAAGAVAFFGGLSVVVSERRKQ